MCDTHDILLLKSSVGKESTIQIIAFSWCFIVFINKNFTKNKYFFI